MKTEILVASSTTQPARQAFCRSILTLAWEFGQHKPGGRKNFNTRLVPSFLPDSVARRFPIEDPSSPVGLDFAVSVAETPARGNGYVLGISRNTLEIDENGLLGRSTWLALYSAQQLTFEGADSDIHCSVEIEGTYQPPVGRLKKPMPIELAPPAQPPLDARELRMLTGLAYLCVDQLRLR